jgi:hypothetical protein
MLKPTTLALGLALLAAPVQAQSHGHQSYEALKDRPIKALSAEDIANLRAGRGMGMALPAELNRYPGPMHALEHEAALGLSAEQKQALIQQMAEMRAAAVALGERIILREGDLEALFRSGSADAAGVDRLATEIGGLYGQLRAVHLRTHLATRATLTEAQLAAYQMARGYDGAKPAHKH